MKAQPLLIEIGCQEIPAGVAPAMGQALADAVNRLLQNHDIDTPSPRIGITPRRLLLHIPACPTMQADRQETVWGPPEHIAYTDGEPTRAALGFAKKTGIALEDFELADKGDGKVRYMCSIRMIRGRKTADIIAEAMPEIIRKLPSPKHMRWRDGKARNDAFIRPICWIVARLGDDVIPFSYAGIDSGSHSIGHRVHGNRGTIDIHDPFGWLEAQYVCADREQRKARIADQLTTAAKQAGVMLVEDEMLLDEVTDLVEWPQVISARYDPTFLRLPAEVSRIELKHHQRCFSACDAEGKVSPVFFAVANIESSHPDIVARGNERVVNARLADAMFYFERDPQQTLEQRVEKLSDIVFQDGLGMVGDQVRRLRGFVLDNADALGVDANHAQRAAYLCKSDLTTGLVGEFPELQGYMGCIYATMDGENSAVATAIGQHYMPAGAEDGLPDSTIARAIGIAERADKLLGYFHLSRIPTASADPFGLRRAAIGLIRLLADGTQPIHMTLHRILDESAKQWNEQRVTIAISTETREQVLDYIHERLLGMADTFGVTRSALDAAWHAATPMPLYHQLAVARLLTDFGQSETGQAVAAANKRIANLLKKTPDTGYLIDETLLSEEAEQRLFTALTNIETHFPDTPDEQLHMLASLRQHVDHFFNDVMVMVEDASLRNNRLALLQRLRQQFLKLADISRL